MDSRGLPTVEVDLATESGVFRAAVPSGVSKGKKEAVELRDGGERYLGMGVKKAISNINKEITPKIVGKDVTQQEEIDRLLIELDGTDKKSRLGANALLPVSLAVCRAGAAAQNVFLWQWIAKLADTEPKLPHPCFLYMEGGLHGRGDMDTQEIMGFLPDISFREQIQWGTEIYHNLREVLAGKFGKSSGNVGLEGGFTPPVQETGEALDELMKAVKKSGQGNFKIILDMAASTFFRESQYHFEGETLDRNGLLNFYKQLKAKYPLAGIEDPAAEEDFEGFQEVTEKLGGDMEIIGDDLLTTNLSRIQKAIDKAACNALILKPNQVGTLTEALLAGKYALDNGWQVFVKHRSGETNDTFIADLAVGLGSGWLMAGAPQRGERVAKYNRLLRIEEELK